MMKSLPAPWPFVSLMFAGITGATYQWAIRFVAAEMSPFERSIHVSLGSALNHVPCFFARRRVANVMDSAASSRVIFPSITAMASA